MPVCLGLYADLAPASKSQRATSKQKIATSVKKMVLIFAIIILLPRDVRLEPELLKKTGIVLEKDTQIIDTVFEHGYALYAHAKGKTTDVAGITHGFVDIWINHAAAKNFQPACALANTAGSAIDFSLATADHAGNVHLGGGFCKGEKAGPKSDFGVSAKNILDKSLQKTSQMGHGDIFANHQSLDLVKHGRMGQIGITPVHLARGHNGNWWPPRQHGADLHGGSVRAQQCAVGDV